MSDSKSKVGYLNRDFEFFHLKDQRSLKFEFHYHDFNKIIIFISGKVNYLIEGKTYKLKPWDILFIDKNDVHMPIIDISEPYERIVLWVNTDFLEEHSSKDARLLSCFELSALQRVNLLRVDPSYINELRHNIFSLEAAVKDTGFGCGILRSSLFLQLIVTLNRYYLREDRSSNRSDIKHDERITEILEYLNKNLTEDLSIENIASKFYMSRYNLMHKFKAQTGFTVHSYIQQKRLLQANLLIRKGMQISDACKECGFGDYTSFVKAYKKSFGASPREYHKANSAIEVVDSIPTE